MFLGESGVGKMNPKFPQLIDGHAHLDAIADIEAAVRKARAAGVTRIVGVGMDVASNRRTLELADVYPGTVYPAVGFHPWAIASNTIEDNLQFVDAHLGGCLALGEVGLDYKIKVKKAVQWDVFSEILRLAQKHQKPLIVHSRFSHQRCHQMVAAAGISKVVFHWYSGPGDILERILGDGYYVSCTPALAYSPPHRAAMERAPLGRILIETDSPVEYQGKPSEPKDLTETLRHLSRIKQVPEGDVAAIVTGNAEKVFGLTSRRNA
jgi:TatD DNase family protein